MKFINEMTTSSKFELAYRKIRSANKILLLTHPRPDGDAVSSTCALIDILEKLGKEYFAFAKDKSPKELSFLPYAEKISDEKEKIDFGSFDLIIALDCGSIKRTFLEEELRSRKPEQYVIEFDHHQKIDSYSDLEIRVSDASSTAEIIYDFYKENHIKFSKNSANCILTGILTDTGNLLYSSTSDKTVRIASEMLIYGAKYPRIIEETWRNKSMGALKMWGKAIGNLEINKKYNLAFAIIEKEDIEKCDCSIEELEGIAGFLSNLHGVKGLVMLRESPDGGIKGSLRTNRDDVDMSKLANKLGGGGHKKASGFYVEGNLKRANDRWLIE